MDPEIQGPNWLGPFVQGDQILGDHLSMGTEFVGDHLCRGINFMGIVCPGGLEVGDWKSGDQMGSGPAQKFARLKSKHFSQFFW